MLIALLVIIEHGAPRISRKWISVRRVVRGGVGDGRDDGVWLCAEEVWSRMTPASDIIINGTEL